MLSLSINTTGRHSHMPPRNIKQNKTYFEMMKITKSNPISKRDGVKNELYIYVVEI